MVKNGQVKVLWIIFGIEYWLKDIVVFVVVGSKVIWYVVNEFIFDCYCYLCCIIVIVGVIYCQYYGVFFWIFLVLVIWVFCIVEVFVVEILVVRSGIGIFICKMKIWIGYFGGCMVNGEICMGLWKYFDVCGFGFCGRIVIDFCIECNGVYFGGCVVVI